jgi:hypothetical protein
MPGGVFADGGGAAAGEPHSREDVERQRRLYTLLRDNEWVLGRYMLTVVAQEAAGFVFGGLVEAFGVAEDEDLCWRRSTPRCRRRTSGTSRGAQV